MTTMAYSKASQAYQRKSDENLSPLQIVVELYRGMLRNTQAAKRSWEAGRLDVMSEHITKTFNIIEALQANLDLGAGEDAQFLNRFYNVIFAGLRDATAKPNPGREFDALTAYIQEVYDRWYVMAYGRPENAETQPRA